MQPLAASVVICTRDRAGSLEDLLGSLFNQSVDPSLRWELIVVDNGSRDRTPELLDELAEKSPAPLVRLTEKQLGLSLARNRGWRAARGRVVAFIDDDATAGPYWVQALVDCFDDLGVGAAGGPLVPLVEVAGDRVPEPAWVKMFSHQAGDVPSDVDVLRGSNMCYRHELLERIGGFDESIGRVGSCLLAGDESDLLRTLRRLPAGRIRYTPDAVVYHRVSPDLSPAQLAKRKYCTGVSTVTTDRKESAAGRFYYLARRHGALALWCARVLRGLLRGRGPDVEQTARFQEFVGYYREWLGGPQYACGRCPMYGDRRRLIERSAR